MLMSLNEAVYNIHSLSFWGQLVVALIVLGNFGNRRKLGINKDATSALLSFHRHNTAGDAE